RSSCFWLRADRRAVSSEICSGSWSRWRQSAEGVHRGQVRTHSLEDGQVRDAPPQEGHAQERVRRQGEEPQTGDRHRVERGAREGRESAPEARRRVEAVQQEALIAADRAGNGTGPSPSYTMAT